MSSYRYKVACFGAGFVGIPTASVLALHNPQVQFIDEIKLHDLWKEQFRARLVEYSDPLTAVTGSDAILILTEWDIFKTYPYENFFKAMQKPSYIFDGRNILNEENLIQIGFRYQRVGKHFGWDKPE